MLRAHPSKAAGSEEAEHQRRPQRPQGGLEQQHAGDARLVVVGRGSWRAAWRGNGEERVSLGCGHQPELLPPVGNCRVSLCCRAISYDVHKLDRLKALTWLLRHAAPGSRLRARALELAVEIIDAAE